MSSKKKVKKVDEVVLPTHAVIYTDGGCRPNSGYGGSGFHGFLYKPQVPKKGTGLQGWSVTPYGYVKHNAPIPTPAMSVIETELKEKVTGNKAPNVDVVEYLDFSQGMPFPSTNNATEAQALLQALRLMTQKDVTQVRIFSDSEYAVNGATDWVHKWKGKDFTDRNDQPISNRNQWVAIADTLKTLEERGVSVDIKWTKGHDGHLGNELSDYQATLGVVSSRKSLFDEQLKVSSPEGYWSPKVEMHPLVTLPRWYFNTSTPLKKDTTGRYVYHFGTHGKDDDFVGKPVSDAAFSIVKLKTPVPALEAIRDYHNEIVENGLVRVAVARTDHLTRPDLHRLLKEHGKRYLTQEGIKPDSYMYTPMASKPLQMARELTPPKTSYHLIEAMVDLETKLDYYENAKEFPNLRYTDITSLLYETSEKKKGKTETKLLSSITNVVKSLSVKTNQPITEDPFSVVLTLGLDLPSRNELSRLAKAAPKVTVMTWKESPYAFRTATVIEAEGEIGIWSGYYANIYLVT